MNSSIFTRFRVVAVSALCLAAFAPTGVEAAVNYFDTTRIVTGYSGSAYCPTGYKLTGGGVYPLPKSTYYSTSSTEYELKGSYPYNSTTWKATATKTTGRYSSYNGEWSYTDWTYSPRVYAICVK